MNNKLLIYYLKEHIKCLRARIISFRDRKGKEYLKLNKELTEKREIAKTQIKAINYLIEDIKEIGEK